MAFQEQVGQLIEKLTNLTENGKVAWEETADENTFLASIGKFVVTLAKGRDESDYFFVVRDQSGKTLEETSGTYPGEWSRLGRLHELARRNALHVEEALTDLLSSLERI